MKRVLIFSLAYYPKFVGGAEVAIKEITDRVSPEEIEFHMVTLRFDSSLPKTEKIGNVIVHRIGLSRPSPAIADLQKFPLALNKYWYQFAAARTASRLHHRLRFDGIWAMMAHSCGVPAGIFKTSHPEVKYLLTLQEGDPPEHIERLARPVWPLFKRGFTQADALQAISNFLLAWGRRMGFKGHTEVIPNAVDTAHFSQTFSEGELSAMHEKIGKKPGDVFLVTTSRLVHKNGIDDVIRALALLPENVHFLIYGIGPDEAMLRSLAERIGVASRTHFAGQIGHAEMPLALKACDIFIRPSRSEGMGNSFIEAMAAELPVIATQEGGIADFLFDAKRNPDKETTGWAVDKDSPEQIAEAGKDILEHPEQVARVKAAAKKMALEKYDWNLVAAQMRTLFDRLLEKR
ncbi:MAG: glycosyltransferase [Minisyncoccota bacterium]